MRHLVVAVLVLALVGVAFAGYISPNALLPSPAYVPLPGEIVQFSNGMYMRNLTFLNVSPQGAPGATVNSFFDVFTEISTDGMTWLPGTQVATGQTTSVFFQVLAGTSNYSAELTSLTLWPLGMPMGVMVRESPTRASVGSSAITPIDTGYRIDSFFDVFTELSVDGGQTWNPTVQLSVDYGQTWTSGPSALMVVGVPEPASMTLLAIGGLALIRRRR